MGNRNIKKQLGLAIIHQHPKILFGMEKRGFGADRWNGFGGKIYQDEDIKDAAKRELREEAGIEINDLEKMGVIAFQLDGNPEISEVHISKSGSFSGEPTESEEMKPRWWQIDEILFKEMWPGDIHWMPLFLAGKKFKAKFFYGKSDVMLKHELVEVNKI